MEGYTSGDDYMRIALSHKQSNMLIMGLMVVGGAITGISIHYITIADSRSTIIAAPFLALGISILLFSNRIERLVFSKLSSQSAYERYLDEQKREEKLNERKPENYYEFAKGISRTIFLTSASIITIAIVPQLVWRIMDGQILNDWMMCCMIWSSWFYIIPMYFWTKLRIYYRTEYPDCPRMIVPPSQ